MEIVYIAAVSRCRCCCCCCSRRFDLISFTCGMQSNFFRASFTLIIYRVANTRILLFEDSLALHIWHKYNITQPIKFIGDFSMKTDDRVKHLDQPISWIMFTTVALCFPSFLADAPSNRFLLCLAHLHSLVIYSNLAVYRSCDFHYLLSVRIRRTTHGFFQEPKAIFCLV